LLAKVKIKPIYPIGWKENLRIAFFISSKSISIFILLIDLVPYLASLVLPLFYELGFLHGMSNVEN